MRAPVSVLLVSLLAVAAAAVVPGLRDLVFPAGVVAAGLVLVALALARRRGAAPAAAPPRWIVIDGSNVMHWLDGTPQLAPLTDTIGELTALGFTPGVVFDANAGHLLAGRYLHDRAFGQLLGLPPDRVFVVPKGTQADPFLLTAVRDLGARIVTNDRFRDWAEGFPEVPRPGHLVRGGYRDGRLALDLAAGGADAAPPGAPQTVSR